MKKLSIDEQINNYLIGVGKEPLTSKDTSNKVTKDEPKQRGTLLASVREKVMECEAKGEGNFECSKLPLRKGHIITQKFNSIRGVRENILYICKDHEFYFNNKDIKVWFTFVKNRYPDKFAFVKREYDFILNEYKEFLHVALE